MISCSLPLTATGWVLCPYGTITEVGNCVGDLYRLESARVPSLLEYIYLLLDKKSKCVHKSTPTSKSYQICLIHLQNIFVNTNLRTENCIMPMSSKHSWQRCFYCSRPNMSITFFSVPVRERVIL